MRYFWVEDFNEGSTGQDINKECWTKYFNIEEYVLKETLEDALIYLEDPKNHSNFDAILIDIRFPVLKNKSERNLDEIYETFFSKRINEKLFQKYVGKDNGHNSDASSGILLFLALILNYGYTADDIAFISANVDNNNLSELYALKELLKKADYLSSDILSEIEKIKYKSIEDDAANYRTYHRAIFKRPRKQYKNYYESLDDKGRIKFNTLKESLELKPPKQIWEIENPKKLFDNLCEIQKKISESIDLSEKEIKYWTVKDHFEKMGFTMPAAFEKPSDYSNAIKDGKSICWSFREWTDSKETEFVTFRRAIIQICKFIAENITLDNIKMFLNEKIKYNEDNECSIDTNYHHQFYLKNFEDILEYVTNNRGENSKAYAKQIVKTAAEMWEKEKIDPSRKHPRSYYEDEYFGLLRLTRNWIVHQGIRNVDIKFASFIFLVSIHSCFNINSFTELLNKNKNSEYFKNENKLLEIIKGGKEANYRNIISQNKLNALYNELLEKVLKNYDQKILKNSDGKPYFLTSKLGDEDNPDKHLVSAQDLYKFFLLASHNFIYKNNKPSYLRKEPVNKEDSFTIKLIEYIYSYI